MSNISNVIQENLSELVRTDYGLTELNTVMADLMRITNINDSFVDRSIETIAKKISSLAFSMGSAIENSGLSKPAQNVITNFFVDKINYTINAWHDSLEITNGRFRNDVNLLWVPDNAYPTPDIMHQYDFDSCSNMLYFSYKFDYTQYNRGWGYLNFSRCYPKINTEIKVDISTSNTYDTLTVPIVEFINTNVSTKQVWFYPGWVAKSGLSQLIKGVDLSYCNNIVGGTYATNLKIELIEGSKVLHTGSALIRDKQLLFLSYWAVETIWEFIKHSIDYNNLATETDAQNNLIKATLTTLNKDNIDPTYLTYRFNNDSYLNKIGTYIDSNGEVNSLYLTKINWINQHITADINTPRKKVDAYLLAIGWQQLFNSIQTGDILN